MSIVSPSAPREEEHQRVETRKIRGKAHPCYSFRAVIASLLTVTGLAIRERLRFEERENWSCVEHAKY